MNSHVKNTLAAAAAMLMISLAACFGSSTSTGASGTSGSTAALRIVAYNGVAATAFRQVATFAAARTEAVGYAPIAVPAASSAVNPAGTQLGVGMGCNPSVQTVCTLQTQQGFFVDVNLDSGDVQEVPIAFYTTSNCTGQAYLTAGSSGTSMTDGAYRQGKVFVLPDGSVGEITASQAVTSATALSSSSGGACTPISAFTNPGFLASSPNIGNSTAAGFTGVTGANLGGQITFKAAQ